MSDKTFPYWLAVEEGKTVRFSDLADMMAKAMHPGDHELISYAASCMNLETELKQAVSDGVLIPRNASGLGRHTAPFGQALQRSVFIPRLDLEPFLNDHNIELRLTSHGSGPDYWTLENAASALQLQLGWQNGARADFLDEMKAAAAAGALVVLDPRTFLQTRSRQVHVYWELVTPKEVNAWLESLGAPYSWRPPLPDVETAQTPARDAKPWEELFPLYQPRKGLYMMVQAAQDIANAEGFRDDAWKELEADMRQAIRDKKLRIRSRHTGRVKAPDPRDFLLLVTVADVNKWLELEDVSYQWKPQGHSNELDTAAVETSPLLKAKRMRRTWWEVSSPYIVEVMKAGQYATAKQLYQALVGKAGPDSPFDKGEAGNRGSLFAREFSQTISLKTVQNRFASLRELAKK